ncbi:MAG: ribosome-associated translation inhibitor RaiA [Candidatus Hydrogenedentes bacterium]|nr:ribosome-associated translation inhibitor RaiA [Candidatus Hydrogenedentota bacterium]
MNITVTGRHMEMTDALKAYIESALEKIHGHFDKVIDADVVLDVEKHRHIAEINLHANGVRIHSKEASPDMYASVDAVIAKLDKQVRKFKDRINRHKPRSAGEKRMYNHAIISMPHLDNGDVDQSGAASTHLVVKHEKVSMKPMDVNEAAMQLDLVEDHDFLVFINAESSQVNVIYSREDGTYGLIEPQF